MFPLLPLDQLDATRFGSAPILKHLTSSSRKLAELKGIAASIPNQGILINTLDLQEAKDRSEIENIITTHDELFRENVLPKASQNLAAATNTASRPIPGLRYRIENHGTAA